MATPQIDPWCNWQHVGFWFRRVLVRAQAGQQYIVLWWNWLNTPDFDSGARKGFVGSSPTGTSNILLFQIFYLSLWSMIMSNYKKPPRSGFNFDYIMKKNWEEMGLLEGLEGKSKEYVTTLFNQVDFELLESNGNGGDIGTYILPVIRRVVTTITDKSMEKHGLINSFTIYGVTEDEILSLINVKEITGLLYVYSRGFIPFAEKFLPNLDAQAESVSLFCDNYIMKLIERVKNENKKIN